MQYQPARAAKDGRSPSLLRIPTPLRVALSVAAAAAIGLIPALVVATAADASPVAGAVDFDADIEAVEGDAFVFELRRRGGSLDPLTLSYTTADSTATATAGLDYTPVSGTSTFPASERDIVKRVTVQGLQDTLDEDAETLHLTFSGTTAGDVPVNVVGNAILDDDDATPSYSLSVTNPVAEAATNAVVTATLSAVSGRDVSIPFSTAPDTAVAPADYTTTSSTIVIPAGSPSNTANIPIVNDAFDEPDPESFTVVGSAGNHSEAVTGGNLTVQIADDDLPPTVSLAGAGNVTEGSTLTFVASLSAPSKKSITVRATTADGTATAGQDYTALNEQLVTFAPGSTSENITVTTLGDSLNEVDPETLSMTLSSPGNATAGTPMTATGGLNDNDLPPALTLSPSSFTEGNSGTAVAKTFTVGLAAPSGRTLHVGYQVNSGTSTVDADYEPVTAGTLTFAPGDLSKTITINVVGDLMREGDETFSIVLNDIDTALAAGGAVASNTITVTDDDSVPVLQTMQNVVRAEGNAAGTATFRATISNPSSQNITFDVVAQGGTAVVGGAGPGSNDFDAPAATATIPAGQTGVDIPVTVNGDAVYEGDEQATITATAQGGMNVTGGPATATLELDNDDAVPTVSLSSSSAVEGSTVTVTATVTGVAQATIPITLTAVGLTNGGSSPADPADFNAGTLTAPTIPAGAATVTLGTILFQNDQIDEANQSVKVTLTGSPLAPASAFQTITDDPNDVLPRLSIADTAAAEGTSQVQVPVTLDFSANGNDATSTEQTIVTHYATTDGTAVAPGDYTAAAAGSTLTFAPGDTSHTVDVPIIDDAVFERSETFTVNLATPSPAGLLYSDDSATVTLADNDSSAKPTFTLTAPAPVAEGAGTAGFTLALSQVNTEPVDFAISAADGTAVDVGAGPGSNDYDAPLTTITIPAGTLSVPIPVTVNSDSVYESTEAATITATLAAGETDATGAPAPATLTITDDDAKPTVVLSATTAAEGTVVPVTATVTGVAQNAMPVTLTAVGLSNDGTSPADVADFSGAGLTAEAIPAGNQTAAPVPVGSILFRSDRIDEPVQTVKVTLTSSVLATVSAFESITDDPNDHAPSASVGNLPVNEGDLAEVPVTLAFDEDQDATSTEREIVVDYRTVAGSAVAPGDYTAAASESTLTFPAGTLSRTVDVPVIDDATYERAETFSVKLTAISPDDATIADDTGVVTIAESDVGAKPNFSVADISVREDVAGGTANFTVTLTDTSTENVTFDVSVVNGTAVEGGSNPGADDFNNPLETLTIPAGATTGNISVPINNDPVYEEDEIATLRVALAAGQTGATGDPDSSTLTIRNDDAVPTITLNTATSAEGASVDVIATPTGVAQAPMSFDLTLEGDSTGGNDPAESSDYTAALTGTIPAGTASSTPVTLTTIAFNADTIDENAEVIGVNVADHAGHVTARSTTYTITDDPNDKPPSISIGDATVAEGVGNASVAVALAYGSGNAATSTERDTVVNYRTVDGTATAGSDFTGATAGTVTIPKTDATGAILVPIINDSSYERNETFDVKLTSHTPGEAAVTRDTGTVTISLNDTEARQSFTVTDVNRLENAEGPANFVVSLGAATTQPVSFNASVTPGTATTGGSTAGSNDYTFTTGLTYTIPAGSTSVTIPVTVNGDAVFEAEEAAMLTVALAAGEDNAVGDPQTGALTIRNDDAAPVLLINTGESGTEGTDMAVIAKPSAVAQAAMTFDLTFSGDESNGNVAAAPTDYVENGMQGTIPAGTPVGTPVTLRSFRLANDHIDEPVETIKVLVRDVDEHVANAAAYYKINDDVNDLPPSVSVEPASVGESDGPAVVGVDLTFDPATNDATSTTRPVTVTYTTVNGTATLGSDFSAPSVTSLTIAAGVLSGDISVPIITDTRNEGDETFGVKLTSVSPSDSTITSNTGTVTIVDDDQELERPTFSVADASKVENPSGAATFTVSLTAPAQGDVSFTVAMVDDTAVDTGTGLGSNDYNQPASSTLTIAMGDLTGTVAVPVNGDTVFEGDETATLHVALADDERDATGDPQDATLTIVNDDTKPTLTLNTASGFEGDELPVTATVTGTAQDEVAYDLSFIGDDAGANNSAGETDYDAGGVEAVIPAGTANLTRLNLGSIVLANDTVDEPTETIKATVHDPDAEGTTGDRTSLYRIYDDPDDTPPTVAIGDVSVSEGTETVDVPVSLLFTGDTTATEQDVTVAYTTVNGTAKEPADYTAGSGTLTIAAGLEGADISVGIHDDDLFEGDQTFTVRLGSATPTGVVVSQATGTVTIEDNDQLAAPTLAVQASRIGVGPVVLSGRSGEGTQVQLYAAPVSSPSSATLVGLTNAGPLGAYSFTKTVNTGTIYYTKAGTFSSEKRTVQVVQVPALVGSSTVKGAATLTVTGNPAVAQQTVQIQRYLGNNAWTVVASGRLNGAGKFSATNTGLRSGNAYTFRAVITATPAQGILGGTSVSRVVTIR